MEIINAVKDIKNELASIGNRVDQMKERISKIWILRRLHSNWKLCLLAPSYVSDVQLNYKAISLKNKLIYT